MDDRPGPAVLDMLKTASRGRSEVRLDVEQQHAKASNTLEAEQSRHSDCQICMGPLTNPVALGGCRHAFCADCISGFVMAGLDAGAIRSGLPCPYSLDEDGNVCGALLSEMDVATVALKARDGLAMFAKFSRLKSLADNPNLRTCPFCSHSQTGDPAVPAMTCSGCDKGYCFEHSNAHPPEVSCEAYLASSAAADKAAQEAIEKDSRKCPGCGSWVTKSAGCNHMKCTCGTSFCWLCGQTVDGSELPLHFQFWNLRGCTNGQMAGGPGGQQRSRLMRSLLWLKSLLILIIIGPLAVLFTLVSFILFPCCCIPAARNYQFGALRWILTITEIWHFALLASIATVIALPFFAALGVITLLILPFAYAINGKDNVRQQIRSAREKAKKKAGDAVPVPGAAAVAVPLPSIRQASDSVAIEVRPSSVSVSAGTNLKRPIAMTSSASSSSVGPTTPPSPPPSPPPPPPPSPPPPAIISGAPSPTRARNAYSTSRRGSGNASPRHISVSIVPPSTAADGRQQQEHLTTPAAAAVEAVLSSSSLAGIGSSQPVEAAVQPRTRTRSGSIAQAAAEFLDSVVPATTGGPQPSAVARVLVGSMRRASTGTGSALVLTNAAIAAVADSSGGDDGARIGSAAPVDDAGHATSATV